MMRTSGRNKHVIDFIEFFLFRIDKIGRSVESFSKAAFTK